MTRQASHRLWNNEPPPNLICPPGTSLTFRRGTLHLSTADPAGSQEHGHACEHGCGHRADPLQYRHPVLPRVRHASPIDLPSQHCLEIEEAALSRFAGRQESPTGSSRLVLSRAFGRILPILTRKGSTCVKKPGFFMFVVLLVIMSPSQSNTTSIGGQTLAQSAPPLHPTHRMIRISQLDCSQYASPSACITWAKSACSAATMTEVATTTLALDTTALLPSYRSRRA